MGGEAEKLTSLPDAVSSYDLSPDGKSLAFTFVPASAETEKRSKEKRDFKGEVTETNGRRMAKGTCPVCGTKMNRILGKV